MKLITELTYDTEVTLEEQASGKKSMYITGTFMQSNVGNKNGRVYPDKILDPVVNKYIEEKVNQNCAWGECGHPDSYHINLDRVSHRIVSLIKEGNNWIGKAKIGSGPMGQVIQALIEDGGKVGVSSRALGDLKKREDGLNEVQSLRLSTAGDIVSDPSCATAWVNGIMENVEFWYDNERGVYVQKHIESTKNNLKKYTTKQINEVKLYLFEDFLSKISKEKY